MKHLLPICLAVLGLPLGSFSAPNATPLVRIVISTAKATYAPGVPIVLAITMKNVSTVPLKVIKADINGKQAEADYDIIVRNSTGRVVERSR